MKNQVKIFGLTCDIAYTNGENSYIYLKILKANVERILDVVEIYHSHNSMEKIVLDFEEDLDIDREEFGIDIILDKKYNFPILHNYELMLTFITFLEELLPSEKRNFLAKYNAFGEESEDKIIFFGKEFSIVKDKNTKFFTIILDKREIKILKDKIRLELGDDETLNNLNIEYISEYSFEGDHSNTDAIICFENRAELANYTEYLERIIGSEDIFKKPKKISYRIKLEKLLEETPLKVMYQNNYGYFLNFKIFKKNYYIGNEETLKLNFQNFSGRRNIRGEFPFCDSERELYGFLIYLKEKNLLNIPNFKENKIESNIEFLGLKFGIREVKTESGNTLYTIELGSLLQKYLDKAEIFEDETTTIKELNEDFLKTLLLKGGVYITYEDKIPRFSDIDDLKTYIEYLKSLLLKEDLQMFKKYNVKARIPKNEITTKINPIEDNFILSSKNKIIEF